MTGFDNESFFQLHVEALSSDLGEIASGNEKLHVPIADVEFISLLTSQVGEVFASEPALLELEGPIFVVGDLHGHLLDLYRIIKSFDVPPRAKYLFLGDYVDRGEFSMETLFFVYVLKVLYPRHVFMIRGNHEFRNTSMNGGLLNEVEKTYPRSQVFEEILDSFKFMPLAATIGSEILCVHGGLSPQLKKIGQISNLERPIVDYNDPVLCGMLWSDPSEKTETFLNSVRGTGFLFGEKALAKFLRRNRLKLIIRGHECVKTGYASKFKDQIMTVFSASNYCGVTDNKAAVVLVDAAGEVHATTFRPFEYLKRGYALFGKAHAMLPSLRKTMHMVIPPASFEQHPQKRGFVTMSLAAMRPAAEPMTKPVIPDGPVRFYIGGKAARNLVKRRNCTSMRHTTTLPVMAKVDPDETTDCL